MTRLGGYLASLYYGVGELDRENESLFTFTAHVIRENVELYADRALYCGA